MTTITHHKTLIFWVLLTIISCNMAYANKETHNNQFTNIDTTYKTLLKSTREITKSNPDNAIGLIKEILKQARAATDSSSVAIAYNLLGLSHTYKGNFEFAKNYCIKGINAIDSSNNAPILADLYNNLAKNYKSNQENAHALRYYIRSLNIRKAAKDTLSIVGSLINIGSLNSSMKKTEIGLAYYLEAEKLMQNIDNKEVKGSLFNNTAIAYRKLGDNLSAMNYYKRALKLYIEIDWKYGQAYVLGNLGVLYEDTEKTGDSALFYYTQALKIHETLQDEYGKGITKINMALVHTQKKQFKPAERLFDESAEIAKNIKSSRLMEFIYEGLAELEESKGNYRKAYDYFRKNREIVDSVYNAEKHKQIAELETKYQTEKKSNEIIKLQQQSQIQQLQLTEQQRRMRNIQLLIILLSVVLILGTTVVLFGLRLNKTKHQNIKNQLEIKNLKTEQQMLKAQMNPHFIYNSLNSIQAFIAENKTYEASKYLAEFARMTRGFLENSRNNEVSLDNEIEFLTFYLNLEQLRFANKFSYHFNIEDSVDTEFIKIPPMLIQPFLENAIIHGFKGQAGHQLTVTFETTETHLFCTIDDDGIGRPATETETKSQKKSSLATQITSERLATMAEQFKTEATVEIIDKVNPTNAAPAGTIVKLKIPIL